MSANDTQVGGTHWTAMPIQCWDFIATNGIGYFEGNVIKYVSRHRRKGGVEDLKKARHYLDKLIELTEASDHSDLDRIGCERLECGCIANKGQRCAIHSAP